LAPVKGLSQETAAIEEEAEMELLVGVLEVSATNATVPTAITITTATTMKTVPIALRRGIKSAANAVTFH